MAAFTLKINGGEHHVDVDPQTPLLWAIRDGAGLTGTKYGCGVAQCGACTVHVDRQPIRLHYGAGYYLKLFPLSAPVKSPPSKASRAAKPKLFRKPGLRSTFRNAATVNPGR